MPYPPVELPPAVAPAVVQMVADSSYPIDPSFAVPKRLGFFSSLLKRVEWKDDSYRPPPRSGFRPLPVPSPIQPRLPIPKPNASAPGLTVISPQPLPANYWTLPKRERRILDRVRRSQERMIQKQQRREWDRLDEERKELQRQVETSRKKADTEEKLRQKQERWLQKYPFRPMPIPTLPQLEPVTSDPVPNPPPTENPLSFMLLPTLEEFGVRRPFDSLGHPGDGSVAWPMMSRTMNHALQDMNHEERVHAVQQGNVWARGW